MDAFIDEISTDQPSAGVGYKSRPGALIWFFRKSRDRWKLKHQQLKATVKGFKNRIADLTRSRERWKFKADQAAARVAQLEAELAGFRAANLAGPAGGENPAR
jgi:hypothetical protein